jgi:chromosome segregation ATPase
MWRAGGATASQQSGAECVGRKARYGHPQQAQTAAVKHVMDVQPAGVLGPLAELGSVQDSQLSALLSAHLGNSLRTLVVDRNDSRCARPSFNPRAAAM